jgi:hypothetical protein
VPKQIARWNPARDVWETEMTGLFCEHSDVYSETWPSSGMTVAGMAYVQPMLVPRMDDSVSSSLLPTPITSDQRNGRTIPNRSLGWQLRDAVILLQTPSVADATGGHLTRGGNRSTELLLPGQVRALLPTPVADHSRGLPQPGTDYASLPNVVMDLLPTPTTEPSTGNGHARNLGHEVQLLPTPTATPYGSNQSPSPGAAVRPSLDTLAPTLLPTPRATDGTKGGPNQRGSSGDLMLPSAVQSIGVSTDPPSDGGND